MENPETMDQINTRTAAGMIATALFIDGVQALLTPLWIGVVINPLIGFGTAFIFNKWFSVYGVRLFSKDNMGLFYGTIAAELIPFFDALPVWTTSVAITLVRNKIRTNKSADTTLQNSQK